MRKLPTESLKLRTQFKPTNIMTMNNPFELIETRLIRIEALLTDLKQNPATAQPDILDLDTLVSYMGNVSKGTVYQWMHRDFIPYFKIGKRAYFRRAEIDDWMKDHRKPTRAELNAEVDEYLANDGRSL